MFVAAMVGALSFAQGASLARPPRVLGEWKIGIWMERRRDADSASQWRWADSTVRDFSRRLGPTASAVLTRFRLVHPGTLPLAGGDPRFHPDLRDTDLDAAWGVLATDSLNPSSAQAAQRAWLSSRGCPDERHFGIGWDLFLLPQDPANRPDSALWRRDAQNYVRTPRWTLLPDSGLDPVCRQILQRRRESGLELFSVDKLERALREALPKRLVVGVLDDGNRPAIGATLEIWRGKSDPRRPFANRLEGRPDTLFADSMGRFPLTGGLSWISKDSLFFGTQGANATSYWRVRYGKKTMEGWMDAVDLAALPRREGWAELYWRLPGGSSRAWREASDHWPAPWVAAEADSLGVLTLGLSVPVETEFVLRVMDARGHERTRTHPIHLAKGVYERAVHLSLEPGWWDVRLDNPIDRFQLRVQFPPKRDSAGFTTSK